MWLTKHLVVFFLWRVNASRRCRRCRMQNVTALRCEQAEDFTLLEIASSPRCRAAGKAVVGGDNWEDYGWFTVKSSLLLKDFMVSLRCRPASQLGVKRMIAWFDMSQKSRTSSYLEFSFPLGCLLYRFQAVSENASLTTASGVLELLAVQKNKNSEICQTNEQSKLGKKKLNHIPTLCVSWFTP